MDTIDQPWLNAAWSQFVQFERTVSNCGRNVNVVFGYAKGIGIGTRFSTYKFPRQSARDLGALVSQLNEFCDVQCIDVWGKSSRIRGDIVKRLKKSGISARYRQMSDGFTMDYEFVQVYAVDSSCER